jgi:hypothetical protein
MAASKSTYGITVKNFIDFHGDSSPSVWLFKHRKADSNTYILAIATRDVLEIAAGFAEKWLAKGRTVYVGYSPEWEQAAKAIPNSGTASGDALDNYGLDRLMPPLEMKFFHEIHPRRHIVADTPAPAPKAKTTRKTGKQTRSPSPNSTI